MWLFSAVETVLFVVAGALLHRWFVRRDVATVNLFDVWIIATVKTAFNGVCLWAIYQGWPEPITVVDGCQFPRKSGGGIKAGTKYALWVGSRAGDSPAKRTLDAAHGGRQ